MYVYIPAGVGHPYRLIAQTHRYLLHTHFHYISLSNRVKSFLRNDKKVELKKSQTLAMKHTREKQKLIYF